MAHNSEFAHLFSAGLTEAAAAERLRTEGPNELPANRPRSGLRIALDVMREPMFLLLISAGAIYFVLGDTLEASVLLGFVCVVIGITFVQERKTERALEALRDLSSPRASVIRDGEQKKIPGRDVVRGDLIVLREGDRVPADGVLMFGQNLTLDESLLTGESAPVLKLPDESAVKMGAPGGDRTPWVFSGSLVVAGLGVARIVATGDKSELGKIGRALEALSPEATFLQRQTDRAVRFMAIFGALVCTAVVVGFGLTRGDWMEGLLAGIALAMATLPEEFPVVLTVFLAMGAWRMSKVRVLTRRVPAIEALGAASVLCVDKTGTLTENRMSVQRLYAGGRVFDVETPGTPDEGFHEVVEYAILASQRDPFDPMERALRRFGMQRLPAEERREHLHDDWKLVREYPLSPALLALSHVWRSPSGEDYVIAAKGSPEAIFDLCHLAPAEVERYSAAVQQLAGDGLRVLGVARAGFKAGSLPAEQHDFDFVFCGLVAFLDPVRADVPGAVAVCREAGIRILMITGDYPATASAIARRIGLDPGTPLTGPEIDGLDDAALARRLESAAIAARATPAHKLRIVNALKQMGHTAAMTGDGVNDAPALKAAHIGVAMGARGTDVAREAADLVLLDDDFTSIVKAVEQGRRIYENIRKAITFVIAVHIPIIGMSFLPVLFGWPLALLPLHIALVELLIDPACSIVFEAEPGDANLMRRPPRSPAARLFSPNVIGLALTQGLTALAAVAALYAALLNGGAPTTQARTAAFILLILGNLGMIFVNRAWDRSLAATIGVHNRTFWVLTAGALAFLGLLVTVPPLRDLFAFSLPTLPQLGCAGGLAGGCVVGFAVLRHLFLRRHAV